MELTDYRDNKKGLPVWEWLLCLFFAAYFILPMMPKTIPLAFSMFLIFAYPAYVVLSNFDKEDKGLVIKILASVIVTTMCYFLFTKTRTIHTDVAMYDFKRFFAKFHQLSYQMISFFMMLRLVLYGTKFQQRVVVLMSLVLFSMTMFETYRFLEIYPGFARSFGRQDGQFDANEIENIGNYYFIYATAAIIPVLTQVAADCSKKWIKYILWVCIFYIFTFLIKAEFSLSLIIPSACIAYIYCQKMQGAVGKVVLLVVFPLFLFVASDLFAYLSTLFESESLRDRFTEVSVLFDWSGTKNGADTAGDGEYRLMIYWDCIKAFLSSPIIGSPLDHDGHATFLVFLSDVGLLGALPYFYMYKSMRKRVYLMFNDKNIDGFNVFFPSFLFILFMGLTNPIHSTPALQYVIWCLTPLILIEAFRSNIINSHE